MRRRSKTPSERKVDGEWVRVAVAPNQWTAGMLEGALESKGIPFFEKKIGFDFPTLPTNDRAIWVPLDREEEARSLVEGISDLGED